MIGKILQNRYIIREVIGTGGMSVVYSGWDQAKRRTVAIKVLRPEFIQDNEFVRRFDNEAIAASKMSHPNIVGVYGVGREGDIRYIIMEHVEGRTLKDLIRQTGRINTQRSLQLALRILAAVDHAHKNHIVHRDIKPQNILVDKHGNVKVADFGIARTTTSSTITMPDASGVLGSVHYFSPEQASGSIADEKSDLYSVGVVIYEMLTGSVPFDGETPVSVALKHVQEAPRSMQLLNPEISKALDEVIAKALAKRPENRYQTAADFANDLKRALHMPQGGFVLLETDAGEPKPASDMLRKPGRGKFFFKLVIVALIVIAVSASVYLLYYLYEDLFVKIKTPNIALLNLEEAVEILENENLKYTIEKRTHNDIGYGYVISQEPLAGTLIYPGGEVHIVVSEGRESLTMPNFVGLSNNEAIDAIKSSNLTLDGTQLEISSAKPGVVIRQEPEAGSTVLYGQGVMLYVSGESAVMPSLYGLTVDSARSLLIESGFRLGTVTEKLSSETENTIISQSVDPDEVALLDTPVGVTISRAQDATYRAYEDIVIDVLADESLVVCMIDDGNSQPREVYSSQREKGVQSIHLSMDSLVSGSHTLLVYIDGVLEIEKEVIFE